MNSRRPFSRRVPERGRPVRCEGNARHVQARLDARVPHEAQAIAVYDRLLEAGWSQRDIVVEGLRRLDKNARLPANDALTRRAAMQLAAWFDVAQQLAELARALASGRMNSEEFAVSVGELKQQFEDSAGDMFAAMDTFE